MHSDRQNVREHDQEAGNVYITHPSTLLRLSSPFRPRSSQVCRPSSVVCRPSSGFTLVELMVVVAVISMLLMLLIPNIRTMREKAWSSQCQNNLRQYGIAMNQYMADYSGYFIYPGIGSVGGGGYADSEAAKQGIYGNRVSRSGGKGGSVEQMWQDMTAAYLPTGVTVQSLSAGNPSVRVCPAVLQQIRKDGNFFDPDSPNFKGLQDSTDWAGNPVVFADFEQLDSRNLPGYDANDKLILDPGFTTYAINITPQVYGKNKKDIPANVVAFIDWNARDGWWATITNTTWSFSGTNAVGKTIVQGTPKWTNAWWLTEVGFHHLGSSNVYGANYVAMDGHVGWIGSNAISRASFTNGVPVN